MEGYLPHGAPPRLNGECGQSIHELPLEILFIRFQVWLWDRNQPWSLCLEPDRGNRCGLVPLEISAASSITCHGVLLGWLVGSPLDGPFYGGSSSSLPTNSIRRYWGASV